MMTGREKTEVWAPAGVVANNYMQFYIPSKSIVCIYCRSHRSPLQHAHRTIKNWEIGRCVYKNMASNINRSFVCLYTARPHFSDETAITNLFFMVQVSYQLMMSDLNPLQSMCPPPPTACLFICLFFKKRNGTGMHRSNPIRDPGNSRVQLSRGELYYYYQPVRLLYTNT